MANVTTPPSSRAHAAASHTTIRIEQDRGATLAQIAREHTYRLTSGVTTPLHGAEQLVLYFSPLKRGRDPGSEAICLPHRYPGKVSRIISPEETNEGRAEDGHGARRTRQCSGQIPPYVLATPACARRQISRL